MRKRMMFAAFVAVLVAAGASAQDASINFSGTTDPRQPGQPLTIRNMELQMNGLTLKADRAVVDATTNELRLEGNVRVTIPSVVRVTREF